MGERHATGARALATGNSSWFLDGSVIAWDNIFEHVASDKVAFGLHATVPSVLLETKGWLSGNRDAAFADPEIGHMALAAKCLTFRYLIFVSYPTTFQGVMSSICRTSVEKRFFGIGA